MVRIASSREVPSGTEKASTGFRAFTLSSLRLCSIALSMLGEGNVFVHQIGVTFLAMICAGKIVVTTARA